MKAETAAGLKTELSSPPGVQFLFKSYYNRKDLTDLGLLNNSDQRSQLPTNEEREGKKGTSVTKATETFS